MPYIIQDKRRHLDPHINALRNALRELESDDPDNNSHAGNLNYIITRLLRSSYFEKYNEINEAVGILECAKLELYRKLAAPYEDQKEFENGIVAF
jgi:hypothetical protein